MTDQIQFKRRINGAAGSPSTAGAKEGEIAFNAPGVAGSTTKPVLFFFDGTAWRTVNPDVTVTTQSLTLTGGADIGASYTAWAATPGNALTGNVVIASYTPAGGGPAQAYVLTNQAAPGTAASWVSLGGAVTFAVAADIIAGTDTTKALNSGALRGASTQTSAGVADVNKIPLISATGKLDSSLLPALTTQAITLAGGTDLGNAYTTWAAGPGNSLTGDVIIATYTPTGGVAQSYILTNRAAPGTAASWVVLGGAAAFAVAADIITGTDTTKALNSAALRGATVIQSTGAPQANYVPRLDATGKLDPSVLPANATHLAGAIDPTAAPPAGVTAGSMYFANKDGASNAGFTGIPTGTQIKTSDAMIFDGMNWHHIPNATDLSAYVPLAGTNLMTGAIVYSGAAGNKAGTVIYDGKGGTIDNVLLDCGTY